MNKARKHVANAAVILLGQGLSRGLGVILLPALTMIFLPAQFGMSALATSYISFISVVSLLGLDLTYLQSVPGAAKQVAESNVRTMWLLSLVLAVCAASVGATVWYMWGRQTPESAPWLGLGIFSTMVFSMCQSEMKANRRYLRLAMALSVGGLVMYLWVLMRGFSGHSEAVTLVSGYALGSAAAVLVSRPAVRLPVLSQVLAIPAVWKLVRIGLPSAFTAPVFWIISSMDRWLVAQFWGVSEAGIYAVAASVSGIGLLFGGVVQTVWWTEASRLHNTNGIAAKGILAERTKEISFIFAMAWLVLVAFSGEIIHLFAKAPFDQALAYLPWLMTSVMLYGMFQALSAHLIIIDRLDKSIPIWIFGGLLFISLSLIFSKYFSPVAIAISQLLVYALMNVWLFILVRGDAAISIGIGRSSILMSALIAMGILMIVFQEPKFSLSVFIIKFTGVSTMAVIVVWHFKNQLHAIVSGRESP